MVILASHHTTALARSIAGDVHSPPAARTAVHGRPSSRPHSYSDAECWPKMRHDKQQEDQRASHATPPEATASHQVKWHHSDATLCRHNGTNSVSSPGSDLDDRELGVFSPRGAGLNTATPSRSRYDNSAASSISSLADLQSETGRERPYAGSIEKRDTLKHAAKPSVVVAAAPSKPVVIAPANTKAQIEADRASLLGVLACILEQLCPLTATLPADPHFLSLFHTSALPGISVRDYLFRLSSYTCVSDECLIQAIIHISTLAKNGRDEVERSARTRSYPSSASASPSRIPPSSTVSSAAYPHPRINSFSSQPFRVDAYNVHRLLLTSILTSAKFSDDLFHNNKIYSSLGGIGLKELNRLEYEYLNLLDYRLLVPADEFIHHYEQMNHPSRHGAWCTHPHHKLGPAMTIEPEAASIACEGMDTACDFVDELDLSAFKIRMTPEVAKLGSVVIDSAPSHSRPLSSTLSVASPLVDSDTVRSVSSSAATTPMTSGRPSASPSSCDTGYTSAVEDNRIEGWTKISTVRESQTHDQQQRYSLGREFAHVSPERDATTHRRLASNPHSAYRNNQQQSVYEIIQ